MIEGNLLIKQGRSGSMRNISYFLTVFIILICSVLSIASDLTETDDVSAGWQQLAKNNFNEAERQFLKAVDKDDKNPRPYLALSFIMQLKEKNVEAWDWYVKALNHLDNPYPYIFSVVLTQKGLFTPIVNKDKGLIKILPKLTKQADKAGVLKAGAIEMLGRYNQEYGDLDLADKYFADLNTVDDWTLIGPFENISASGYDKVFAPELEYDETKTYEGENGIPAKWFHIDRIRRDKWIDFKRYFAQTEAIFYGNTFIYSPEKQIVQIRVGTSGSVKTFLNQKEILSSFDENNNDLDTYIAQTELQQGWNRLLIKCGYSEITQCNFMVRITDIVGNKIENLKYQTKNQSYTKQPDAPVKIIRNFAELYFEEQIIKFPDKIENYLLLADCYLRNDKAIEAELILRKAQDKMPDCVLIMNHLLEAYLRGEKYDEIASTTARIFSLYPDVPAVLDQKYGEYMKNENIDQLEDITNRYSRLLPGSAGALLMQMNLAFKKGQFEQGFKILNEAYDKYPNRWEIAYLSALLSIRTTQKYDRAIEIYNDFLKKHRLEAAYIQLANTYLTASKVDKFEDTFNKFIDENPASPGIYFALANVFTQLQNYNKAEKYLREALKMCTNNSVYWAKLGEIKQGTEELDEAIKAYQTALTYSATDYESRKRLRELEGKNSIFSQFEENDIDSLIRNAPDAAMYPNDCAVYLLDDRKRVVYDKGASEIQNEVLVKVFNADGIDDFKEYWLPYYSYSEKLIIEKAVAIKSDGSEIKADINDNDLVFKSLEPNDFIYIKWHIQNYNHGRLSQHIWEEINFNYYYPVEKISYSLLVPEDFQFNHKTQNMDDAPIVKRTDYGNMYQWKLKNQASVISEYNMPGLDDVGKMLYISSIPNWDYLVDWYLDLAKTKTRISYEIKETVDTLLSQKTDATEIEKINLIYNYITENIAYSSVSFRQSALIPQKARDVLVKRIGDCKDVATLCIAMLKQAGIPAHYVLVNTFDEGQNKNILPSIAFNHAIVGVNIGSQKIYMDLTAKNYPLFTVPENDKDAFALNIVPGESKPFYLIRDLFKPGLTKRITSIVLRQDNSAQIKRTSIKYGTPGASLRNSYRFKSNEDQIKELTETLSEGFPNVQLKYFKIKDINEINDKIEYEYEFNVPFYLVDASDMKLLKLPWSDNLTSRRSLSSEKRNYEYEYRATSDTLWEEMVIQLPQAYEPIDLKNEISFKSEMAEYQIKMKYNDGKITANRRFVNKMSIIPAEKYPEFKEFYNKAMRNDANQILLKKTI